MTETPPPNMHRRAKLHLNGQRLAHLLRLPEGVSVHHTYASNDPVGVSVIVEGELCPLVHDQAQAPIIALSLQELVMVGPDGELWHRYELGVPEEAWAKARDEAERWGSFG